MLVLNKTSKMDSDKVTRVTSVLLLLLVNLNVFESILSEYYLGIVKWIFDSQADC